MGEIKFRGKRGEGRSGKEEKREKRRERSAILRECVPQLARSLHSDRKGVYQPRGPVRERTVHNKS